MHRISAGMSLLELLIALTILTLLLAVAAPPLAGMVEATRQHGESYQLHRAFRFLRSEAVARSTTVTLCGSLDGSTCSADWQEAAVIIFIDRNRNGKHDADEELLRAETLAGRWLWRGSAARPYLRIAASGQALEWGTFHRCAHHGEAVSQLVVNRVGRSYSQKSVTSHPDC